MKQKTTFKKMAAGAAVAAAVGYVAGLLSAPKSGREMRKEIKSMVPDDAHDLKEKIKLLYDELVELLSISKQESMDLSPRNQEKLALASKKAIIAKEKLAAIIANLKHDSHSDKDLKSAIRDAERAVYHFKEFLLKK